MLLRLCSSCCLEGLLHLHLLVQPGLVSIQFRLRDTVPGLVGLFGAGEDVEP